MYIQPLKVSLAGKATSPSKRVNTRESNEISFDSVFKSSSTASGKNNKDTNQDMALISEVGFYKNQVIMKTVNQIVRALERAKSNFPQYQEYLEGIEDLYKDKLPRSLAEAMSRLNEVLEILPGEFKDKVFQYLEDEKQKDERLIEIKHL